MLNNRFRTTFAVLAAGVALAAAAAPAEARINNNDYEESAEGYFESHGGSGTVTVEDGDTANECDIIADNLAYAEQQAELQAGTKGGRIWSGRADTQWDAGVEAGCWE